MTQQLEDMNFTFSWQKQYFSHSLAGLVCKMLFCHLKIKFISSHHRVISSTYKTVSMIIHQTGQHKVLLPINHNNKN